MLEETIKEYEHKQYITDLITENGIICQKNKEIERLNKALLDIKEILKKQSISLDWEPWSTYQVSGQKLFDIAVILDKVLGSDKEWKKQS